MTRSNCHDDVAVIGMACRVAGANSPSEFWDVLATSRDVQSQITRFNVEGFYHPEGAPRKGLTNVKNAYMLDDNAIDKFDNSFFHTTPLEAIAMDPQQRMLLEIAYEAVENAGIPLEDFVGTDTAVYAGEHHLLLPMGLEPLKGRDAHVSASARYLATGTATCMAANRLSYFFDLSGPSLSVDSACSSTMAALHQAVLCIQTDEASMALVCGAKLILTPDMFMPSSELGFLSPSGRCRSFDAGGDGYGRGEGVLALLLKPLKEALADNDTIRAVIKGTRLNQDGRTQGITLPSADAQRNNMEALYSKLGLSPNDIQYVEAHGTGTAAGDPLEFSAINAVFESAQREQPLVVGSTKSNIGHLEACAALAGIVKTIECLERGKIPPQMHFINPNPKIDFQKALVPIETMEWPTSSQGVRRAAVNTFGAGGTNGHAVLEAFHTAPSEIHVPSRPLLYKVSAIDESALKRLSLKYAEFVEAEKPCLYDLAYTLLSRRSRLMKSTFFTAYTSEEVIQCLRAEVPRVFTKRSEPVGKIVFIFTGQGAQWAQMGKLLIGQSPIFKAVLQECERVLASLPDKPAWSIIEELSKSSEASNIHRSTYSQPLCTALQLGLVVLWKSWGLVPNAILGHSSGEIAAAYAAGILSLRDSIVIAYYRGLCLNSIAAAPSASGPKGGMCAVGLDRESAQALAEKLADRIQVAAVNSPTSCTLSGDREAVEDIIGICKKEGTFCRALRVDIAYHSHHMLSIAPRYEKMLVDAKISLLRSTGECAMFSSVTGREVTFEDCSPSYWKQNMVSTVQFAPALMECLKFHPETSIILEVGPHPALKAPTQETLRILDKDSIDYHHSCYRGQDDLNSLLETAGAMIARGVPLKTANINGQEIINGLQCSYKQCSVLKDLPSYQWDHSASFWSESRVSRNVRRRKFPRHQLLGSRYVEDIPSYPSWRNHLMLKEVPWFMQLQIEGAKVIPPVVFLLMALEAARQLQTSAEPSARSIHLSDIFFEDPMPLGLLSTIDSTVEMHLHARQIKGTNHYQFEIMSLTADTASRSTRHCSGNLKWTERPPETPNVAHLEIVNDPFLLRQSQTLGQNLSSSLQVLETGPEGSTGRFDVVTDHQEHYYFDPLILNSILQLPTVSLLRRCLPAIYRVFSIQSIVVSFSAHDSTSGRFAIDVRPNKTQGGQSTIEMNLNNSTMIFSNIQYEMDHLIQQAPALKSLYFKPVMLPDISTLATSEPLSISKCLELLTHKWPMSDVGINLISDKNVKTILRSLSSSRPTERPRFRSIQILGKAVEPSPERVRVVDDFSMGVRFHMLFVDDPLWLERIKNYLRPSSLLCVRGIPESSLSGSFTKACPVTGLEENDWTLWHRNAIVIEPPPDAYGNTVVFACPDQPISFIKFLPAAQRVPLQRENVRRFCRQDKRERYDAVVVDCVEKSIITTWAGVDLVLWLQELLASANSIIWVTQQASQNPFTNVAGTLLRTLQSEQPSLKVTWLSFGDTEEEAVIQASMASACSALSQEEHEVHIQVNDSQRRILRYLPDDGLSASTGLILPRVVDGSLVGMDYELALSKPQELILLTSHVDVFRTEAHDKVEVSVEASVIDVEDLVAFNGTNDTYAAAGLGRFFAGRVTSKSDAKFPFGSPVVGWQEGAHRNRLQVSPGCLRLCDGAATLAVAAAEFAVIVTALCIVDGSARARAGDTFKVNLGGSLGEAIRRKVTDFGATVIESQGDIVTDFVVDLKESGSLLVNESPVHVEKYLQSQHGKERISQSWEGRCAFKSSLQLFELPDYREAFQAAREAPYSTVLVHLNVSAVKHSVPLYRKAKKLLSSDGAYVVIGGLGGLGRFICSWMVANGAKRIIVISRNGLKSKEAEETYATINASDASMEVIMADACDREAVKTALAQIRMGGSIKGVINMAMLLGDAPMAVMTGEQWDRALRLKIDSGWILHEETLEDRLDVFIMFSSIASVLGNRNQGGYNVGNTFLNALASYRRSLGRTGISIALGAMTDIGVLHDLGREDLLPTLSRSGLSPLRKADLAKIMEAAVLESSRPDRSLILTGLEMFARVDGQLRGSQDQTQLYWTELPEFGHLQSHRLSDATENRDVKLSLRDRLRKGNACDAHPVLLHAFLAFLAQLLGFGSESFNPALALAMYGLDSLSAVSCQYWFYRELVVDVSVADVFNAPSISQLVADACGRLSVEKPVGKVEVEDVLPN